MKHLSCMLWCLCLAALLALQQCSPNIAGGGGTETGNPAVMACAQAAFDALDVGDGWSPIAYVPGGRIRLNPQSISFQTPTYRIAKQAATAALAETTVVLDTLYITHYQVACDTLYKPESTFVRDTLVREYFRTTLTDSISSLDTSSITTSQKIIDSTFIIDTIIAFDTIIRCDSLRTLDTLFPGERLISANKYGSASLDTSSVPHSTTPTASSLIINQAPTYNGILYVDSSIVYDFSAKNTGSFSLPVSSVNQTTNSLSSIAQIQKRYATASGIVITEAYRDEDGDALLLTATDQRLPEILYSVQATNAVQVQNTYATFSASKGFVTNSDSTHLTSLLRNTTTPVSTQMVLFAYDTLGFSHTDSSLIRKIVFSEGQIESLTVIYSLTLGPQPSIWTDDFVSAITIRKYFRSGEIKSIHANLTPNPRLINQPEMSTATGNAILLMADGSTTTIYNASINLLTGEFIGELTDQTHTQSLQTIKRSELSKN